MSLLSLNPLLSGLIVTYANRAAVLESTATPSPESEDWKALQNSVDMLREENEKLKLENRDMILRLEAAEASREALYSLVLSFRGANATQHNEIKTLRKELVEAKGMYDQFVTDSNGEKAAYKIRISDLEVGPRLCWLREMCALIGESRKQTQLVRVSKLECQFCEDTSHISTTRHPPSSRRRGSPTPSEPALNSRLQTSSPEGGETASRSSPASIPTRKQDQPTSLRPGGKTLKHQLLSRVSFPETAKSSSCVPSHSPSRHKKPPQGGWLKALNDSF